MVLNLAAVSGNNVMSTDAIATKIHVQAEFEAINKNPSDMKGETYNSLSSRHALI